MRTPIKTWAWCGVSSPTALVVAELPEGNWQCMRQLQRRFPPQGSKDRITYKLLYAMVQVGMAESVILVTKEPATRYGAQRFFCVDESLFEDVPALWDAIRSARMLLARAA